MGPTIILDKSAIQSLSQEEIMFLSKHYFVVVTPILIAEIMADLSKTKRKNKLSEDEVAQLSKKLQQIDSVVNAHSEDICVNSLLGYDIPITGQAIVSGGIPVETKNGKKGVFFDEPPERRRIRDWQDGIFLDTEKEIAQEWRKLTRALNLEAYRGKVKSLLKDVKRIKSFNELDKYIEKFTSNPDKASQFSLLARFMQGLGVSQNLRNMVCNRWLKEKMPLFKNFAPYSYYCLRAKMLFTFGLACNLVSTKSTNFIDLEYLYYLPFCMVFSSGDDFHRSVCHLFLREDQEFVDRDTLKKDLRWLSIEWNSLNEAEKREREYDYGSYPPKNPKSITYQLWLKYMKPWKPGSGNLLIKQTEEEQKKALEELRPYFETVEKYKRKKNG